MPYFSRRKIISHQFHVDINEGESGIGYEIIEVRELVVQIILVDGFGHRFQSWENYIVTMNEPGNILGYYNLTKRKNCKVFMQTTDTASKIEATDRVVTILYCVYVKV